ncbi:endo-1,4-beta-xylanase-like, partial [Thalictrum thalictroides]
KSVQKLNLIVNEKAETGDNMTSCNFNLKQKFHYTARVLLQFKQVSDCHSLLRMRADQGVLMLCFLLFSVGAIEALSYDYSSTIEARNIYTFSAWIQVSEGKEAVTAVVKMTKAYEIVGTVFADSGCWSMLKGGISVDSSGPAELYFESKNTSVEIRADSISLQPFTKEQWRSHQDESIEKVRKTKVRIHAVDSEGRIIGGAKVSIKQIKPNFPFGSAMNKNILTNTAYQNWFTSRFALTTFENEMKWYVNEAYPGKEDYSVSDAMLQFAKQHGIAVRGHNIFWDDETYQLWWVKSLSSDKLRAATEKRINSVVSKYAGQVIAWDVVNENLHFSFFEERLGKKFTPIMFEKAHQIDSKATMFLNDYNTIEESRDRKSTPTQYIQKIREIQSSLANKNVPLAIGLEGHFGVPNIAYMRSALDTLAATGLPIWLTELDVKEHPKQAEYLEEILREAHSHPAVKGIILWTAWLPNGCYRMCLTDNNFKNLPTGDVVDKLISEWTHKNLVGTTNNNGFFETSLFHGDYEVEITHPNTNSSLAQNFKVSAIESSQGTTLQLHIII